MGGQAIATDEMNVGDFNQNYDTWIKKKYIRPLEQQKKQ